MTYIALGNPEMNVSRVDRRAITEKRTVSGEDVRRRYARSLDVVGTVVDELDEVHVFDNSGATFKPVLTISRGIVERAEVVPAWTERAFARQLGRGIAERGSATEAPGLDR